PMDSIYSKPCGMNDAPATPLRERLRSSFANGVVGTVGVSVDVPPICRLVQSPLHTPATGGRCRLCRVSDQRTGAVQEAGPSARGHLGRWDVDAPIRSLT